MAYDKAGWDQAVESRDTFSEAKTQKLSDAKRDFLGIGLSCLKDLDILTAVEAAIRNRKRLTISFINPDYVLRAHRIDGLRSKINRFDIVLPDGWGVVMAGRWLGLAVSDRQSNDDICPRLFELSAKHEFSNFLLGCREGVAEKAALNLTEAYPSLPVVGTLHGYWRLQTESPTVFHANDAALMVKTVNNADPDILYVSLPTPLQQSLVWQIFDELNVPVIITSGAYLEHLAERIDWYPVWINKIRVGWVYRLIREPRRLWKRYSIDLIVYAAMVMQAKKRAHRVVRRGRHARG